MAKIVIDGRPLAVRGGMQTYVRELLANITVIAGDNEYVVALPAGSRITPPGGLPAVTARSHKLVWAQWTLPALARRTGADILHATKHAGPITRGVPFVLTVPDLMYFTFPDLWKSGEGEYWRLMTRLSAPKAAAVIFISETSRQDGLAMGLVPEDRAFNVPLAAAEWLRPVEDPAKSVQTAAKYGVEGPYVLTVGTIGPKKNMTTIVKAFALLQKQCREPLKLVITGRNAAAAQVLNKAVADSGVADSVVFTGWVDGADLPALYCGARVFVFAALYEGFGLPPLEAMQCGVPVVSSREGSLAEIVDGAAVTVDSPLDVEEFAHAMLRVVEDETLRTELREKGLTKAGEFSWEKTARQTIEIYERVLGR